MAYGCSGISTAIGGPALAESPLIVGASDEQNKKYLGRMTEEPLIAGMRVVWLCVLVCARVCMLYVCVCVCACARLFACRGNRTPCQMSCDAVALKLWRFRRTSRHSSETRDLTTVMHSNQTTGAFFCQPTA